MNQDELICFCFKKSKLDLRKAIDKGEEAAFIEEVKAKMKDPGCFCEKANPSGKCCLKNISDFILSHNGKDDSQ